ncbi:MAG: hypothetical protein LBR68_06800, partial [Lachnoclostridium sp.]|nr:hypothetical protein [Lachnoclostridium sp.]
IEGNIKRESAKNSSNGIVNDNNARDNRNMIKEYKKKFREKLQKKMTIRLEQDMIVEYNHISDFVATYYIGSERVRVMKQKAHLIIEKLFDFYMEHEDMLPIEYNHSIAFEAQKLSTLKDEFSDCKNKKRLIVIQYIFERIEENKDIVEIIKKMSTEIPSELISHENQLKDFIDHEDVYQIILCVFNFLHNSHNWKNNIDDNNIIDIFGYIYENIEKNIFNNNNNDDDFRKYYHGLCRHIAKARVITNYIASMTDRYAEKKYNEIVSSSTSWSVSFHE